MNALLVISWVAVSLTVLVTSEHPEDAFPSFNYEPPININTRDAIFNNRLPRTLIPYHYELVVRPELSTPSIPKFKFTGTVRIHFKCEVATSVLHLNVKYSRVTVDTNNVGFKLSPENTVVASIPELLTYVSRPEIDLISFQVKQNFVKGAKYIAEVHFFGWLGDPGQDGFYWDSYKDKFGRTEYIAATQLESIDARKMFPCMDEVDMKATFDISVQTINVNHIALSNMPVARTVLTPDGWTEVQFQRTPKMSTYLVCVIVGNFKKRPVVVHPSMKTMINLYAVDGPQFHKLEYIANFAAAKLQKWYDDNTGFPYKEPKMDHVALPSKSGAMENWGIITYGEELLCVDNETTSVIGKFNGVTVVSHELAHMWYGNLVTCMWWDDLWVQEGLATHYNYNPTETLGWDWRLTQLSDQRRGIHNFMIKDQKNTTEPVRKAIDTPQDSESAFTSSTYNKGGALIRMIQGILTQPVMNLAFKEYLKKYQYTNVVTKDLLTVLDEQAKKSGIFYPDKSPLKFEVILKSWLNIHGFPLLQVKRDSNTSNKVVVSQSLYLHPRKQTPANAKNTTYLWEIPMTLVDKFSKPTAWDANPTHWIRNNKKEETLSVNAVSWYILNPKQHFYYRVLYDAQNRAELVQQLAQNYEALMSETRAQLIDDNFDLARNGYLSVVDSLEFTKYLSTELAYSPWEATLRHIHFIQPFFEKDKFYPKFLEYFSSKLDKILEKLRYEFPESETVLTTFLRKDAISSACSFANKKCLLFAKDQFKKYIFRPDFNLVNANALPTVLCQGLHDGTADEWDIIWRQYTLREKSNVKDERHAYIFGLTCTTNTTLLDKYFDHLTTGRTFNKKDVSQATLYLASTIYGADKLFQYLEKNWEQKNVIIPKASTITTITKSWYTKEQQTKLSNFIASRKNLTESESQQLIQSSLQVDSNINFYAKNKAPLEKWLNENVKPNTKSTLLYIGDMEIGLSGFDLKNIRRMVSSVGRSAHQHWSLLQDSYYVEKIGKMYQE